MEMSVRYRGYLISPERISAMEKNGNGKATAWRITTPEGNIMMRHVDTQAEAKEVVDNELRQ